MLGFNGDSVTYLPDKGDTLVRLICYDVPGDVMVDSFDDADFRESFAVGARFLKRELSGRLSGSSLFVKNKRS